jgi:hypothetical protein
MICSIVIVDLESVQRSLEARFGRMVSATYFFHVRHTYLLSAIVFV